MRSKSNEEFTNPQLLYNIIRLFGTFLGSVEPQIQIAAAQTLLNFAAGNCIVYSIFLMKLDCFRTCISLAIKIIMCDVRLIILGLSKSVRGNSNVNENNDDQRSLPRDYSQQLIEKCAIAEVAVDAFKSLLDDDTDKV